MLFGAGASRRIGGMEGTGEPLWPCGGGSDSNVVGGFAFAGGTRSLARLTARPKRSGPAVQAADHS